MCDVRVSERLHFRMRKILEYYFIPRTTVTKTKKDGPPQTVEDPPISLAATAS
jgi:hypothetical protein